MSDYVGVTNGDEAPEAGDSAGEQSITVTVDGEEQTVSLEEARNGYMRQAYFTKRSQDLARAREQLQRERQQLDSLRGGGGGAGFPSGLPDMAGSINDGLLGGDPPATPPMAMPWEQPQGTTAPPYRPQPATPNQPQQPVGDDDGFVERRELGQLHQGILQMQQQQRQLAMAQQQFARQQQESQQIVALSNKYRDSNFQGNALEEFGLQAPDEQARLRQMPAPVMMELLYGRRLVRTGGQTPSRSPNGATPFSESSQHQPKPAPEMPAPLPRAPHGRRELTSFMHDYNAATST